MGLTAKLVKTAKYRGGQDLRHDDDVPGLALRVFPSGAKSYVIRYRTKSGRQRMATVGKASVLSLKRARDKARRMLVAVSDGGDPVEEKRSPKGLTIKAFVPIFMERHSKARKATWREDERRIEKYILPKLGSRALADVKRGDVAAWHSKIGRRAPVEANRLLTLLGVMFACAERWGFLPEGSPNPCRGVQRFKEQSRERYVTPQELPRLVAAIDKDPNPFVRGLLWMYLLTGARKSELLRARWTDVDAERQELKLPATKSGRPHTLPLSGPALAVLEGLPRYAGNPFIFPGNREGQPLKNIDKNWRAIRRRAGLEDVRLHDLRRTVGSWLAASGASLVLIGKVLNQSTPSATAVYARLADESARVALDGYGEQVMRVVKGGAK